MEVTLKQDEQLLGESSEIGFKIILLPRQLTSLVSQSNFVFLQSTDFLVSYVKGGLQPRILVFKSSDRSQLLLSKLCFIRSFLLRLGQILVLLLQGLCQLIYGKSSEISIREWTSKKDHSSRMGNH